MSADKPIPNWVNKWLLISGLICIMDGGFCVLRPHSLEGGCLEMVFYAYRYYTMYDLHYADQTDSFVWAQGLGNIIESALNLLVVFDVLKSVRKSKLLAIVASIMTAWKTVLFCLYSLDVGQGGHTFNWFAELVVLGPALIWIVFPVYAAKVLMEDFLNTKTLRSKPSDDGNDVTDSPSPRYYLRKR